MEESEIRDVNELLNPGEIPRQQWGEFLEQFAINFEGWIVDVEWPGADPVDEAWVDEATEYVLEGIECDLDNGDGQILIRLSNKRKIVLDSPERIELRETQERTDELLEVEAFGLTCCLHLRFPEAEERRGPGDTFGLPSEETGLPEGQPEQPVEDELNIVGELPF